MVLDIASHALPSSACAPGLFLLLHNVVAYVALLLRHDPHHPHDPGVRFTLFFLQRLWDETFLQHV
jgi:hypothetical protein